MVGFIEFLQQIVEYCEPGKMTDLTIYSVAIANYRSNENISIIRIDDELVAQVQPFLRRLEKL